MVPLVCLQLKRRNKLPKPCNVRRTHVDLRSQQSCLSSTLKYEKRGFALKVKPHLIPCYYNNYYFKGLKEPLISACVVQLPRAWALWSWSMTCQKSQNWVPVEVIKLNDVLFALMVTECGSSGWDSHSICRLLKATVWVITIHMREGLTDFTWCWRA